MTLSMHCVCTKSILRRYVMHIMSSRHTACLYDTQLCVREVWFQSIKYLDSGLITC